MMLDPESTSGLPTDQEQHPPGLPPSVMEVLELYRPVFSLPSGMPPQRPYDHHVHLLPGMKPINVRPYRYPYFKKNEIERQVKDMLDQGIIQRSSGPFSSPVLLIRKKDGSFCFCIDYRALNTATVPDHFPIPTADELFDELGKPGCLLNWISGLDIIRFVCMTRTCLKRRSVPMMVISSSS